MAVMQEPTCKIYPDKSQEWMVNGQRHRIDAPAVTGPDGREEWWQKGLLHRMDGPAVIYPDGEHIWYMHGKCVTDQVHEWMILREVTWPWNQDTQMEFTLTWL